MGMTNPITPITVGASVRRVDRDGYLHGQAQVLDVGEQPNTWVTRWDLGHGHSLDRTLHASILVVAVR